MSMLYFDDSYAVEWMRMLLEPVLNLYLLLLMPLLLMMHLFCLLVFTSFLLILGRLACSLHYTCYYSVSIPFHFFTHSTVLLTCIYVLNCNIVQEASSPNRTLDLASALEIGPSGNKTSNDYTANSGSMRSVMTIAFEFAFESHMQENVASIARQYVRSIISSVQRVALALSPSNLSSHGGLRTPLGTPEANTLARWICNSYRCVT